MPSSRFRRHATQHAPAFNIQYSILRIRNCPFGILLNAIYTMAPGQRSLFQRRRAMTLESLLEAASAFWAGMTRAPTASYTLLQQPSQKPRSRDKLLIRVGAIAVVLGLVLGLGVGFGLIHRPLDSSSSSTSSSPTPSLIPSPQSNFVLDGLKGQPPQTRTYHFVVSEVEGAPDGALRPMLVVNGAFPVVYRDYLLPYRCYDRHVPGAYD